MPTPKTAAKTAAQPAAQPAAKAAAKVAAKVAKRDPAKTRANILKAATVEFAAKGYSGARTEQIAKRAKSNIRMLYHYFGGKDGLYLVVLEEELARLRTEELQLDFSDADPLEGVLQMYDFIDGHFSSHPTLRNLLAFENLNKAMHLKRSARIPQMASPVLVLLGSLLQRGQASGAFRAGIDALHLYVAMVSLSYYAKSHAHTLSRIFARDLLAPAWQQAHRQQTHAMLGAFLALPATPSAPPKTLSKTPRHTSHHTARKPTRRPAP